MTAKILTKAIRVARQDISIVRKEIETLKRTTDLREFNEAWQNTLQRLERIWEITNKEYSDFTHLNSFLTSYRKLRKHDPLLVYLKQARNAETHGTSSSVGKDLIISINDRSGMGLTLKNFSASIDDGDLDIKVDTYDVLTKIDAKVVPADPKLLPVTNRHGKFFPPIKHLGAELTKTHPADIADKGLAFYQSLLDALHDEISKMNSLNSEK